MSTIDILQHMPSDSQRAVKRTVTPTMAAMQGSKILGIATQVRQRIAAGQEICNLTVGDFRPSLFPVPGELSEQVILAYRGSQTNYPPADGIGELKEAVTELYKRDLGLDYPAGSVCVGSGARPPLYAAWRLLVQPGDRTVSFLPMWNVGYYAHLLQSDHQFISTTAENNFFPTVAQVEQALPGTRLVVINSPLNPTGTVIGDDVLRGIAEAIVAENRRRVSEPPVMLLFDQVYWMLTADGVAHKSPVQLVPEVAPYVIHVDAISKCFAATGLRVGWAVLPPYLQPKMRALIGHMGAWAARPEQQATAWFLNHPQLVSAYMLEMKNRVMSRLNLLYSGIMSMKADGLPVDAISPQGAIYLSLRVDLVGRGFDTNEQIRQWLLEEARVAVVPFQAFDLPEQNGWFRMSVGAVGMDELDAALTRMGAAIRTKV